MHMLPHARTNAYPNASARTLHVHVRAQTPLCPHTCALMHAQTQELLGLYDEIEHTKKMGIVYGGNTVTKTVAGTSAERQGVQSGWRIAVVPLHACVLPAVYVLQHDAEPLCVASMLGAVGCMQIAG